MDQKLDLILDKLCILEDGVQVLRRDVFELKEDVGILKQDVHVLKEDVSGLKQDVHVLKEDVSGLKQDVSRLEHNVGKLQDGYNELNQITQAVRHGQEVTHAKLDALTMDVRKLQGEKARAEDDRTIIRKDINYHKYGMDVLNRRQFHLEAKLELLQNVQ